MHTLYFGSTKDYIVWGTMGTISRVVKGLKAKAIEMPHTSTGSIPGIWSGLYDIPQEWDPGSSREEEALLAKGVHHFALSPGLSQ